MFRLSSLFLLIFFVSISSKAAYLSFGVGGITTHYTEFDANKRYCNELKDTAAIFNQTYYHRFGGYKWSFIGFIGQDSICSPIIGGLISRTLWSGKWWRAGMVGGLYKFDIEHWERWAEQTALANEPGDQLAPEPVDINIGGTRFVPVAALEFSVKLFGGKSGGIWLNNLISIFITNHSLNYVIEF